MTAASRPGARFGGCGSWSVLGGDLAVATRHAVGGGAGVRLGVAEVGDLLRAEVVEVAGDDRGAEGLAEYRLSSRAVADPRFVGALLG